MVKLWAIIGRCDGWMGLTDRVPTEKHRGGLKSDLRWILLRTGGDRGLRRNLLVWRGQPHRDVTVHCRVTQNPLAPRPGTSCFQGHQITRRVGLRIPREELLENARRKAKPIYQATPLLWRDVIEVHFARGLLDRNDWDPFKDSRVWLARCH